MGRRQSGWGGVGLWTARLTRNVLVVCLNPIKGSRCFLEHETLPLMLSLVCFRYGFERDFTNELK